MTLRQELRKVLPLALRQGLAHRMRQLRDTRRGLKFDLTRVTDLAGYTVPVSYTHLDVYKRQSGKSGAGRNRSLMLKR